MIPSKSLIQRLKNLEMHTITYSYQQLQYFALW